MARRRPRTRSVVSPISITLLVTALNAGFGVGAGACQTLAPPLREPSMRPARSNSLEPLRVAAGPSGTPVNFGFRGLSRDLSLGTRSPRHLSSDHSLPPRV